MCLGIPARVLEVDRSGLLAMGTVDFGGVTREVCLAYVPEAQVDDYVIVHAGFAISLLDEEEARASLDLLREVGLLEEESGVPLPAPASP
ncbi:MAG: HypC/HybG/HupF family hydrogenase formation chaperone [Anaerolineae bacterium]|nr:HypC/HybG/HupF family hydrogenase formation chaperone [Anaerolineae bacterium]